MRGMLTVLVLALLTGGAVAKAQTQDFHCGKEWVTFPITGRGLITGDGKPKSDDTDFVTTRRKADIHSLNGVNVWLVRGKDETTLTVLHVEPRVRQAIIACLD